MTKSPTLHVVQNDVIEPDVSVEEARILKLARALLGGTTTEEEVAQQLEDLMDRGAEKWALNLWVDEVVDRTRNKRKDVNKVFKRVEARFAKKQAEAKPETGGYTGPLIGVDGHDVLMDHGQECLVAATDVHGSSRLLSFQNGPAEIMRQDDGRIVIHPLNRDEFAEILDKVARFRGVNRDGDVMNVPATREMVTRLFARMRAGVLPSVTSIVTTPCLLPDGILDTPGLHHSGLYFEPTIVIEPLPEVITDEITKQALDTLRIDLFGDAMLGGVKLPEIKAGVTSPALANAIALLLTPFVRPAVSGGVPIFFVTKAMAGAGSSTMLSGISWIALGHALTTVNVPEGEEAFNKYLLSEVISGALTINFDNATGNLDIPSLARATTTGILRGRQLGATKMVEAPWRQIVTFTGNRPVLSEELVDRTVILEIDPDHADPATRKFQHKNYEQWVQDNRAKLVRCVLILIANWLQKDRPECLKEAIHPRFGEWSKIVGGVLFAAGVTTFNQGRAEKLEDLATSDEADEHQRAVEAWARSTRRGDELLVQDLVALWEKVAYVPPRKLRESPTASPHDLDPARVGRWLKQRHGAVFAVAPNADKPEDVVFIKLNRASKRSNAGFAWSLTQVRAPSEDDPAEPAAA